MLRAEDGSTQMESAHRASYQLFVGPIPAHSQVRQTCGNRLRINPDHLELLDNAAGS